MHVRVTNQIFPQAICIPMSNEMTITQWHVPIDDENCFWYAIFTSYGEKVDRELMLKQRLELYELPGYVSRRNKSNNYGFDAREQRTETYTGMGHDINVHDQWAVESQGSIQDRTREHLGKSDIGIIKYRRMLMQALDNVEREEGPLPMLGDGDVSTIRGPVAIDEISSTDHWQKEWKERDLRRRSQSGWAKNPWE
jgi:phthalate 4,5-dioxygenase oxygenase subunit